MLRGSVEQLEYKPDITLTVYNKHTWVLITTSSHVVQIRTHTGCYFRSSNGHLTPA